MNYSSNSWAREFHLLFATKLFDCNKTTTSIEKSQSREDDHWKERRREEKRSFLSICHSSTTVVYLLKKASWSSTSSIQLFHLTLSSFEFWALSSELWVSRTRTRNGSSCELALDDELPLPVSSLLCHQNNQSCLALSNFVLLLSPFQH